MRFKNIKWHGIIKIDWFWNGKCSEAKRLCEFGEFYEDDLHQRFKKCLSICGEHGQQFRPK